MAGPGKESQKNILNISSINPNPCFSFTMDRFRLRRRFEWRIWPRHHKFLPDRLLRNDQQRLYFNYRLGICSWLWKGRLCIQSTCGFWDNSCHCQGAISHLNRIQHRLSQRVAFDLHFHFIVNLDFPHRSRSNNRLNCNVIYRSMQLILDRRYQTILKHCQMSGGTDQPISSPPPFSNQHGVNSTSFSAWNGFSYWSWLYSCSDLLFVPWHQVVRYLSSAEPLQVSVLADYLLAELPSLPTLSLFNVARPLLVA